MSYVKIFSRCFVVTIKLESTCFFYTPNTADYVIDYTHENNCFP